MNRSLSCSKCGGSKGTLVKVGDTLYKHADDKICAQRLERQRQQQLLQPVKPHLFIAHAKMPKLVNLQEVNRGQ